MALEPCNVCGTLNSDQEEICLSCGYPTKGRKRPAIFQWAAITLVLAFALPMLMTLVNFIQPQQPTQPESDTTQSSRLIDRELKDIGE
ncbi:MAG: hypothetical protein QNJ49_06040 [Mastigocoleus sp. MO_167.B18]|uniref:hypothetical protein n=1 Tax=Mastigocoleus sp. MO_188.B34 TaxID=3036635 RepID=UPI00262613B2|nr:hypothetical protein [Mastigocoleus sp. MO_188.B34]MDJ0693718.1 hypothetical protein [Mastigocoleus sp. MO_188.B34]MDJ0772980.1 hypothetical protein [Mastigocoleus sp. MO_167.B18]